MMRTLVDPRVSARVSIPSTHRRRMEQRARRWVLRELDRLEKRTAPKDEQ
jgi:hypothetical protein